MSIVKRIGSILLILLLLNLVMIAELSPLPVVLGVLLGIVLSVYYVYFNLRPSVNSMLRKQKRALADGCELMLATMVCFMAEVFVYITVVILSARQIVPVVGLLAWVVNTVVCVLGLAVLLVNGVARIFAGSGQLGVTPRILLLCFWWMPVANIILLRQFFRAARSELQYTANRERLNAQRLHESVCRTKYPLLMVHGIFFRDWEHYNYWGRITTELAKNGAQIFYGSQRSSASVAECAEDIKASIQRVLNETGCDKVNIIAHSKGGLDSRYAVSKLGMAPYVASLTTINTPHRGCNYVKRILEMIPQKTVKGIGKHYNTLFTILGDDEPDFLNGLAGLTDTACDALNREMPDMPGVLYQSVASKMNRASGAMFPLSVGYRLIKHYEGDNDGLVSVESMKWGDFLGVLSPHGAMGISHGDIIDLTRKNIPGFDVCEYYIDLVYKLKMRGL